MEKNRTIMGTIYSIRDLYPAITGQSTAEETIPDNADQQAYNVNNNVPTGSETGKNIGMWFLIIVGIIIVLHIGRGE